MPQTDLGHRGGHRRGGGLRLQVMVQVRLRLRLDVQLLLQQEGGSRWRLRRSLGWQSRTSHRGRARWRGSLRRTPKIGSQMGVWQVTNAQVLLPFSFSLPLPFPFPFPLSLPFPLMLLHLLLLLLLSLLLMRGCCGGKQLGMQGREELLHARGEEIGLE